MMLKQNMLCMLYDDIGIETVKCKQLEGENGCARATLVDGDRVFLGSNEGGIRGKTRTCIRVKNQMKSAHPLHGFLEVLSP